MSVEERNNMIIVHMPFIKMLAGKYGRGKYAEDLIQEGVLGLIKAWDGYDPSRNTKFLTYAGSWIKAYMIRWLNKTDNHPVSYEDDALKYIGDPKERCGEINAMLVDVQRKICEDLKECGASKRDIDIILSRYLSEAPLTLQELGDRYSISRERVRQLEARMLARFKNKIL